MNLLFEKAPDHITVGGKKIRINDDFGVWVEFLVLGKDGNLDKIKSIVKKIFIDEIPQDAEATIKACYEWLYPEDNSQTNNVAVQKNNSSQSFDFGVDGNVIYCELWEYFPHLMQRGVSFHEGKELIKVLMHNENTMLWHRAFARCGDFSKMSKEQKKYWQQQRAIWAIPSTEKDVDNVLAAAF